MAAPSGAKPVCRYLEATIAVTASRARSNSDDLMGWACAHRRRALPWLLRDAAPATPVPGSICRRLARKGCAQSRLLGRCKLRQINGRPDARYNQASIDGSLVVHDRQRGYLERVAPKRL
jgi:hypothetical protein